MTVPVVTRAVEKIKEYPSTKLFLIYISFMVTLLFIMAVVRNGGF